MHSNFLWSISWPCRRVSTYRQAFRCFSMMDVFWNLAPVLAVSHAKKTPLIVWVFGMPSPAWIKNGLPERLIKVLFRCTFQHFHTPFSSFSHPSSKLAAYCIFIKKAGFNTHHFYIFVNLSKAYAQPISIYFCNLTLIICITMIYRFSEPQESFISQSQKHHDSRDFQFNL